MIIARLNTGDLERVSSLVRNVFDTHVAPLYPEEGCSEFYTYIDPEFMSERLAGGMILWGALDKGELVGVLALKDPTHISLFFVADARQGQGIGRLLFDRAAAESAEQDVETLTVNASPNAVQVYTALGFEPDGPEQTRNGITFHRMTRSLADYRKNGGFEQLTDDSFLPGPRGALVCGFSPETFTGLGDFLKRTTGGDLPLFPLDRESLDLSIGDILGGGFTDDPLPAEALPRVVLLSGVRYADVRSVVESWSTSDLPRPVFATTTARNLYFPARELLRHLMEERRRQTGKDT